MLAAELIINKILQNKDINIIKTNGLEGKHFQNLEPAFNYIMEHYKQYGNVPDSIVFLSHFPDFDIMQVNESDDFLVGKIYEEYGFTKFSEIIPVLNQKLKEDSRLAYDFLKNEMETTLKPRVVCKGHDLIEDAMERYELYLKKQEPSFQSTISTGFPELDDIIGGWEYGEELAIVAARTGAGKSWTAANFLTKAWEQGKRVGLYSGEMSHIKLGYRFDTLYNHNSNNALVRGHYVDGYKNYIDNLKDENKGAFIVITQKEFGGKPTVRQLANFIEENKLDILGIDQLSLMDDGRATRNDPPRMRLAHISEDLFALSSEYKIPIIALAQVNREGVRHGANETPGIENIKESDDISHNCSKCLMLSEKDGELTIEIAKNREGKKGDKLHYYWDIDKGFYSYIPTNEDGVSKPIKEIKQEEIKEIANLRTVIPF